MTLLQALPLGRAAYAAGTRRLYEQHLGTALARAATVLAVSDHTARTTLDLAAERGFHLDPARVEVAPLGYSGGDPADLNALEAGRVRGLGLDVTPFLLFIGSSHEGARLDDLVAAFNRLRARGRVLKLVLVGSDLLTSEGIVDAGARRAVERSSYRDDIHLFGAVGAAQRAWLQAEAAALVLPGELRGSGLPVVEAGAHGCPVVAYDDPSIREVAGPGCVLVPPRWEDLSVAVESVLDRPAEERERAAAEARAVAATRTWDDFGTTLADAVTRAARRPG